MTKQHRKHQVVSNKDVQGHLIEETLDDSILPNPSDIERLHKIDSNILDWAKDRTETEQNFRHSAWNRKMELLEKDNRCQRIINVTALYLSFIITILAFSFSGFLIYMGQNILGSIFGGGTLLLIITSFLNKINTERKKQD